MNPIADRTRRRLAAVLFADIEGYTELASETEDRALRLVGVFQNAAREIVPGFGGRVVKFLGDGVLTVFDSADHAVRAAVSLRQVFAERAGEIGASNRLHAGVHLGEIVTTADGDAYGDGVNVASRLQSAADPGQVLVSEDVWRQLRKREDFVLECLGMRELKGLAHEMSLYAAEMAEGVSLEPPIAVSGDMSTPSEKPKGRRGYLRIASLVVLIGIVVIAVVDRVFDRNESPDPTALEGGTAALQLAAIPTQPSVAVLPFATFGEDRESSFFSEGIMEDIITRLSKIENLKVISRTSAMRYRDTEKTIREIASELGVNTVLEGSVRQADNRVRIVAQLIDAETDAHLWAETYDRELEDIFGIQTEVAQEIADALEARVTESERERMASVQPTDIEAYRLYQKGRGHWDRRTAGDLTHAIQDFERAIEIDPEYALAWAGLAQAYAVLPNYSETPLEVALARAKEAALQAITLDPEVGEAHTALAQVLQVERDWEGAEREFQYALELAPGDATTHHWYAWALSGEGRHDEAIAQILVARELDPGSRIIWSEVGLFYVMAGRYDEAVPELRAAIERDPEFWHTYQYLAWAYELSDRFEEAVEVWHEMNRVLGREDAERPRVESFRVAFREGGEPAYWQRMLLALEETNAPRGMFASVNAQLGRADEAFQILAELETGLSNYLTVIKGNRYLDPIHDDPRWGELMERIGLE